MFTLCETRTSNACMIVDNLTSSAAKRHLTRHYLRFPSRCEVMMSIMPWRVPLSVIRQLAGLSPGQEHILVNDTVQFDRGSAGMTRQPCLCSPPLAWIRVPSPSVWTRRQPNASCAFQQSRK
jgi:hypothetical protein